MDTFIIMPVRDCLSAVIFFEDSVSFAEANTDAANTYVAPQLSAFYIVTILCFYLTY
jgi:hypothetical protein